MLKNIKSGIEKILTSNEVEPEAELSWATRKTIKEAFYNFEIKLLKENIDKDIPELETIIDRIKYFLDGLTDYIKNYRELLNQKTLNEAGCFIKEILDFLEELTPKSSFEIN